MSAGLLDRETIERALNISGAAPLIIALSGGGDSTALLHALADRLGAARLHATIVDHGLREGSRGDAEQALAIARGLNVSAEIVCADWRGEPKRAQGAAREARYRALCNTARARDARVIAVAHTLDDQAETVLLRAAVGSTWRGLAGMAPLARAPLWPEGRDLWLARPLLDKSRAELRAMLSARGASWIEDPANENANFARVRARRRLAALGEAGFDAAKLAGLAGALRPHVERLDAEAAALIGSAVRFELDKAQIVRARWDGGVQARRRALSALLAAIAGAAREPDAAAVAVLAARLGDDFSGATLGGVQLRPVRGGVRLSRDLGALEGRADGALPLAALPLPAGAEIVWDGRLAVSARAPGWRIEAEEGRPIFVGDGARLAWADAVGCSVVTGEWLIEAHVRHILPVHSPVTAPEP